METPNEKITHASVPPPILLWRVLPCEGFLRFPTGPAGPADGSRLEEIFIALSRPMKAASRGMFGLLKSTV